MRANSGIKNIYFTPSGKYRIQVRHNGKLIEGGTFRYLPDAIEKLDELNEKYPRHMYKWEQEDGSSGNSIRI